MSFEVALGEGRLEEPRSLLDDLARASDTGGLWLPECYADLAQAFDRRGRHDDAIASMEGAIAHGWSGRPDPRSDIAEFHLRAGRRDEAARIWADLKTEDPDDVWLYNAAGLSYSEIGDHELAVVWLGEGIELAMQTGDPEGIVPQLSEVRRSSLEALGRDPDELEGQADEFVAHWRDPRRDRSSWTEVSDAAGEWHAAPEVGEESRRGGEVAVAMAWFPSGEYEKAIARWESVAEVGAGASLGLLPAHGRPHQVDARPWRSDPGRRSDRRRRVRHVVRGSWPGPGGSAGWLRGRALSAGRWDRLASRPERPMLVRLSSQVQEVLRVGPGGADARRDCGLADAASATL